MNNKNYNNLPIIAPNFIKTKENKKETKALKKIIDEISDTINLENDFWVKERLKFTLFLATALLKEKKNEPSRKKTSNKKTKKKNRRIK